MDRITKIVLNSKESVFALMDALRHSEPAGLSDMSVVEDLYKEVHREFTELSHTPELSELEKERGY